MTPSEIKVENSILKLRWGGDSASEIPLAKLRRNCPCAFCAKERSEHSEFYIPLYNDIQLKVSQMSPVGSYALNIIWSDGHNSGIYEYDFLRELALLEDN